METLGEAIREHLELRRLRGVDPRELAREEEAAFGLAGEEPEDRADHGLASERAEPLAQAGAASGLFVGGGMREEAWYASQETAEIDMRTILGTEPDGIDDLPRAGGEAQDEAGAPRVASGVVHHAGSLENELDRLDWEVSRPSRLAGR